MGRPSKLTPELQRKLCDAIAAGNYLEAACSYAGVDYSTFTRWMKRKSKRFRNFRNAVLEAEAKAEVAIVAQWRKHMPENWQACRDFLARRYSDRWGPKERQEISGPGGEALEVPVVVYIPSNGRDDQAPAGTAGSVPK